MTLEFQEMMEDMRQKPIKTRGHGTYDPATGTFNFMPSLPGEPVQKAVRKLGESKLYETEGEKHSSIIVHLKVDRNLKRKDYMPVIEAISEAGVKMVLTGDKED